MEVCYYYQILDIGILYEKGRKNGRLWRIGERKRLNEEVLFWKQLLNYIKLEEEGQICADKMFFDMEKLCKKYYFPNYKRIIEKKDDIVNDNCNFHITYKKKTNIYNLINELLNDMECNINKYKDKEKTYRILMAIHNLPKVMHGCNKLNTKSNLITYEDALKSTYNCMDENMKKKYEKYFNLNYS